jgi:hypothetical protein
MHRNPFREVEHVIRNQTDSSFITQLYYSPDLGSSDVLPKNLLTIFLVSQIISSSQTRLPSEHLKTSPSRSKAQHRQSIFPAQPPPHSPKTSGHLQTTLTN